MTNYLPGVIPLLLGEFLIVLLLIILRRRYCSHHCATCCLFANDEWSQSEKFEIKLEKIHSPIVRTTRFRWIITLTRISSFGYIAGCSVLANFITNDPGGWFYFTNWNVVLLSIYFLFASVSSIVGLTMHYRAAVRPEHDRAGEDPTDEGSHAAIAIELRGISHVDDAHDDIQQGNPLPPSLETERFTKYTALFGYLFHILFEVCGGTACLVTVVAFALLNPEFSFWNASLHFVTIAAMVAEMSLNSLFVRLDHFHYNLGWGGVYLIFIWPAVSTGLVKQWPYYFLYTDTYYSFFWYTGLVLINFIFYLLWYILSEFKYFVWRKFIRNSHYTPSPVDDTAPNAAVEDGNRTSQPSANRLSHRGRANRSSREEDGEGGSRRGESSGVSITQGGNVGGFGSAL
jgi:hypothetical protein